MRAGSGDHLLLKRGAYYCRQRIPNDLRAIVGKSDITVPLGTKNRRQAARLARAYAARLELAFERLRTGELDDLDDRRTWVRAFAAEAMVRLQRGVDEAIEDSISQRAGDIEAEGMSVLAELYSEGVDEDEDEALRAVLIGASSVDPDLLPRETWRPLAIALLKGIEGLRFTPTPPPLPKPANEAELSNGQVAEALAKLDAKLEAHGKAKNSQSLGEAFDQYAVLRASDDQIKASTVEDVKSSQEYRLVLRLVDALGPDTPMDEVTSVDIVTYLDALVDFRITKGDSVAPPISSGTRRRAVSQFAAFWRVAVDQEWCSKNVAKSVARSTNAGKKRRIEAGEKDRTGFPADALPKIFSAELQQRYGQPDSKHAETFWMLSLYLANGLRAEESAQSRLGDLKMVEGIRCFHVRITDPATQTLKNLASERLIPLHPVLQRLGFQQYIDYRRAEAEAAGEDFDTALLFAGLKPSKTHGYRNALCQWTNSQNGYLASVGVWKRTTQVLHSLRHNCIAAMIEAGIPTEFRLALSGHGGPSADEGIRTYAGSRSIPGMFEHLSRIDWDSAFKNVLPE